MSMSKLRLYYVHDPMCSWCYGLRPILEQLKQGLPKSVQFISLLGGLAADSEAPMPKAMRAQVEANWFRIEKEIPGTRFNHEFWSQCQPRRSTYRACRAVVAARAQDPAHAEAMTRAIQDAFYQRAMNPSDRETLEQLAGELGLDVEKFSLDLDSATTKKALQHEIEMSQSMGVGSFPSLVLANGTSEWPVPVNYQDVNEILATIAWILED